MNLDDILAGDSVLQQTWVRLHEAAIGAADTNLRPRSVTYSHMDHGPGHWEVVRECAEKLWAKACVAHPDWANAEAIFTIKAASLLHDIGMTYGYNLVAVPETYTKLLIAYRGSPKLDFEAARSPVGEFILRQIQAATAEAVIAYWCNPGGPLEILPASLRDRLVHVITSYHDHPPKEFSGATSDPQRSEVHAACLIVCFADWHHVDTSRTNPSALDDIEREFLNSAALWASNSSKIPYHGAEAFLLPKLLRCYYVRERHLDDTPTGGKISFDLTIARPPVRKADADDALRQLQSEWRDKLYPSRIRRPVLADSLQESCGISLQYQEPGLRDDLSPGLLPIPPVAIDYWIADQWFSMGDQSQYVIDQDIEGYNIVHAISFSYKPDDLFREYRSDHRIGRAKKPTLKRAAFLAIHLKVTWGISWISRELFRHLGAEVTCSHRLSVEGRKEFSAALEAASRTVRTLMWRRWLRAFATRCPASSRDPETNETALTVLAEGFFLSTQTGPDYPLYAHPRISTEKLKKMRRAVASVPAKALSTAIDVCIDLGVILEPPGAKRGEFELDERSAGGAAMLMWANTNPLGLNIAERR